MSKAAKLGRYEIELTKLDGLNFGTLASASVSQHQLDVDRLQSFANTLLAKFSGLTAQEMLPYFVNKRKGSIRANTNWKLRQFFDEEKSEAGYYCAEPPYYFVARHKLPRAQSRAIAEIITENRKSSNV